MTSTINSFTFTGARIELVDEVRTGADIGSTSVARAGMTAGAAFDDRYLIAALHGTAATATAISSCTFDYGAGVVSGTSLLEIGEASNGFISIWGVRAPTGTTVSVTGTVTSGTTNYTGIQLYSVRGLQSETPTNTATANGAASSAISVNINEPENGFILGIGSFRTGGGKSCAWTGTASIVEAVDDSSVGTGLMMAGAIKNCGDPASTKTVIVTPTASTDSEHLAVLAMR